MDAFNIANQQFILVKPNEDITKIKSTRLIFIDNIHNLSEEKAKEMLYGKNNSVKNEKVYNYLESKWIKGTFKFSLITLIRSIDYFEEDFDIYYFKREYKK